MNTPCSPVFLAAALCCSLLPAQTTPNLRDSIRLDPSTSGTAEDPGIASVGELTAVIYGDDFNPGSGIQSTIHVTVSDGRGLSWSSPVRVDDDNAGTKSRKFVQNDCVWINGDHIYAVWEDRRFDVGGSNDDLYFAKSTNGGLSFQPEVLLDKGYAPGSGSVRTYHTAVSGDNIYVLVAPTRPSGGSEDLFLIASTDGGANWNTTQVTSAGSSTDVDDIAVAADGLNVHALWVDNRSGNNQVWYRRSSNGGSSWGSEMRLDSAVYGSPFTGTDVVNLVVQGAVVAASWSESSGSSDTLLARVSTDGGASFATGQKVGNYGGGDDVDNPDLAINADGTLAMVWEDNRGGGDQIYAARSTNNGSSWANDTRLSTSTSGYPRIIGGGSGFYTTWTGNGWPDQTEGAFSLDNGATWSNKLTIGDTTGDSDFAEIAWNDRYGNFMNIWLADDTGANRLYVGGFRPQTLAVNGTIAAGNVVNFQLNNFGTEAMGAVLISGGSATGSYLLPFGDNRETGLLNDGVLATALGNIPGLLSTNMVNGSGTTPNLQWPNTLPSGTMLYMVGVSFDTNGGVSLGDLTDVVVDQVQ